MNNSHTSIFRRVFGLLMASLVAGAAASQAPENLQVLTGVPPDQLQLIMDATSASLGVECEHCHVPGAFALDDLPSKRTAREMMRMVGGLATTTFELLESPSCWTCHRGTAAPESAPPTLETPLPIPFEPFSASTDPAGDVYENIQTYASLPAGQLRDVMASFTRALGVECDHCHVAGDWSSDANVLKQLTRVMVEMQRSLVAGAFAGAEAVSCWTCHRGEATPESSVPPELVPALANER